MTLYLYSVTIFKNCMIKACKVCWTAEIGQKNVGDSNKAENKKS
jgi:hypothetical protein